MKEDRWPEIATQVEYWIQSFRRELVICKKHQAANSVFYIFLFIFFSVLYLDKLLVCELLEPAL